MKTLFKKFRHNVSLFFPFKFDHVKHYRTHVLQLKRYEGPKKQKQSIFLKKYFQNNIYIKNIIY